MSDWRSQWDAALLRLERERDGALRTEAALQLCDLADQAPANAGPELISSVARVVSDRQADVRMAGLALAALVLSPAEAQGVLSRHLTDSSTRVRVEAAGRLADLVRPDARGALAAALEDEAFEVRFEGARGMAALRHPAGLEVLVEALQVADLRFRAAASLAVLGHTDAIGPLKRVLGAWLIPAFDRTQVAGALARLGDADGIAYLFKRARKSWSADRAMAIELLGEVRAPGARERLLQLLASKNEPCRGAAARGLGWLGDPSVAPALLAALDEEGLDDSLRLDLAEGLLRSGSGEARARLERLCLSEPEAREELAALLASDHPGFAPRTEA